MKIDYNSQVVFARPNHGLVQVVDLALDVWLPIGDVKRPKPDWQAYVVKARHTPVRPSASNEKWQRVPGCSNVPKVVFSDPRIPMLLQRVVRDGLVLVKAIRPLVDNAIITCVIKQRRRDPRLSSSVNRLAHPKAASFVTHLENEPTTQVHAADFLRVVGKPPRLSNRDRDDRGKRKSGR
jgi:hypothetical protein